MIQKASENVASPPPPPFHSPEICQVSSQIVARTGARGFHGRRGEGSNWELSVTHLLVVFECRTITTKWRIHRVGGEAHLPEATTPSKSDISHHWSSLSLYCNMWHLSAQLCNVALSHMVGGGRDGKGWLGHRSELSSRGHRFRVDWPMDMTTLWCFPPLLYWEGVWYPIHNDVQSGEAID